MRVLMQGKGGLGSYCVDFIPIHNDWLSWKSRDGELNIIHEQCYYAIVTKHSEGLGALGALGREGVCAKCGVEAPSTVRKFILLANRVREYDSNITERDGSIT